MSEIVWESYAVLRNNGEYDGIHLEYLYQAFKARLINELTYTGQIMEPLRSLDDSTEV